MIRTSSTSLPRMMWPLPSRSVRSSTGDGTRRSSRAGVPRDASRLTRRERRRRGTGSRHCRPRGSSPARCKAGFKVQVLVETTAGQGTALGHKFEHLATIFQRAKCADRMAVCFDTCHIFAAGYAITSELYYSATFQQFDDLIGLSRLKLFHVNDSAKPFGSRVDRHAGIGRGEMGRDAFRRLVTDTRFVQLPMILETPKEDDDGNPMDAVNLGLLREFAAGAVSRAG